MKKGDEMYILKNSWEITWNNENKKTGEFNSKVLLYIERDAYLYPFPVEGSLLIRRVKDDLSSGAFEIDFPEIICYRISNQPIFDTGKYLDPSEINFDLIDSTNVDDLVNYQSYELWDLRDLFHDYLNEVNIDYAKPNIEKILNVLSVVAENEFKFFDEEVLESSEIDWNNQLEENLNLFKDGIRKKFAIAFDEKVIEVIQKIKNQNLPKKNIENTSFEEEIEKLSLKEQEKMLNNAIDKNNFKLLAKISKIIK